MDQISRRSSLAFLTLHVGEATFRSEKGTPPGFEEFEVSECTATMVNSAKRVVAVGTTVCRVLEHLARSGEIRNARGVTDLVLSPGSSFKVTGALMTNFHLPESSPLALAAAFAGKEFLLSAYSAALEKGFRFASYGDAMLIL